MSRYNNGNPPIIGGFTQSLDFINNNQIPAPPSEISTTSSEATSSPYIPTPLSSTSNDLPLPKVTHSHKLSNPYQRQSQQQPYQNLQQQLVSSSSNKDLTIHEPPYIPSTFLPSYYSESRFPHASPSSSTSQNRIYQIAENDIGNEDGNGVNNSSSSSNHDPTAWEKLSKSGPSQFDLLEGINLPFSSSIKQKYKKGSSSSHKKGNDLGIKGYTSVALMDLAGLPHNRDSDLIMPGQFDLPVYNAWSGGGGGSTNSNSNTTGPNRMVTGLTTWQPGPSSTSASQFMQSQFQSQSQSPSQSQDQQTNSPFSTGRHISASPHQNQAHLASTSSTSTSANASPRFQPYPRTNQQQRIISSASPATSSNTMLPPPNPQNQQSSSSAALTRSWSEPNLPENTPLSAGYPGNMYANVPLPEGYMSTPPFGGRAIDPIRIGVDEFTQAYEMYNHILSAIPYIIPSTQPELSTSSYAAQNQSQAQADPTVPRQTFDSLVSLAADSYHLLSGSTASVHPSVMPLSDQPLGSGNWQKGKRRNSNSSPGLSGANGGNTEVVGSSGGSKKAATKCLGCGATETPEWRRGPMGPRTLCNACGLVHMKLQRKKKKQEEKARAAAAAAASGPLSGNIGNLAKPG